MKNHHYTGLARFGLYAWEHGLRSRGATHQDLESSGMSPDPDEIVGRDRTVSRLRKAVDEGKFNKMWGEGRKLSLDQAVHYSLEP